MMLPSGSESSVSPEENFRKKGIFPATRWSLILAAGSQRTADAQGALEELCRRYWSPVYVAMRGSGASAEEAKDLTQDFFCMLLRRADLKKVSPEKGRFRAFLRTAMRRFMTENWRHNHAEKRHPGTPLLSIDAERGEEEFALTAGTTASPDEMFDYQWARGLLERCLAQLRTWSAREGKTAQFEALVPYLDGMDREGGYAEFGRALGVSEGAARSAMFRLRNRYRRLIREEIALTLDDEADLEDEIRQLFAILSR